MRRVLAALILIGFTAVVSACGEPPAEPVPLETRRDAALAGIDWMAANSEAMPAGWAYPNLSRLQRVTPTGAIAERLERALEANTAGPHHRPLPRDLTDPSLLHVDTLTPILQELLRRKENGLDWQEEAQAIGALATEKELAFWRSIPLRQRPAVFFFFEELEIPNKMEIELIEEALRQGAAEQSTEDLAENHRYIYALTHVALARSRYFQQPVDATDLEFMIPILQEALDQRLEAREFNVFILDLIGEVMVSLKLLGVPEDDRSHRLHAIIIGLQNPDGSWGRDAGVTPRRIHPTLNAILALLPPGQFATGEANRQGPD